MKSTRGMISAGVLCALVLLGGCDGQERGLSLAAPEWRASDGLLSDPELQAVVDAQVRRAWEPLVEYLGHDRVEVRARAAFALASVQAYQAVPALVGLLQDGNPAVRRDAAFALGQSAQREAGGAILAALDVETDPDARHRLIEALGKLGFEEVLQGLLDLEVTGRDEADRLLAIARLGAMQGMVSEGSQNALMAKLDDPDADARRASAYFFGRAGDAGTWAPRVGRIREALDAYQDWDRAAIHLVKALGRLRDPADAERLLALASSAPDWRVRAEAMSALAGRPMDDVVRDVLFAGLDDASIHVAVNAAGVLSQGTHLPSMLGRIATWVDQHPDRWQVAAPLLGNLARQDEQEFVLGWVDGLDPADETRLDLGFRVLGQVRGEDALARLRAGMARPSARLSAAAVVGLRQRWSVDKADPRLHATYFEIFREALSTGRDQAVFAAAPALSDPIFVQYGSLRVLTDAMTAAALPEDLEQMTAILATLGQTGQPEVRDVIWEALEHPYQDVRRTAARALGQHFGEEVEAPGGGLPSPQPAAPAGGADPSVIDWVFLSALGGSPRLILETEAGRLVVEMSTEEAPHTVQTIARLAQEGRFDGVPFHRVVPNFVAQGGDVSGQRGRGGAGFAITTEITQIPYERGVIGMASGGKDTESSQFFLVHSAQPHLDGGYTAFGRLSEGAEALDGIAQGDLLLRAWIEVDG